MPVILAAATVTVSIAIGVVCLIAGGRLYVPPSDASGSGAHNHRDPPGLSIFGVFD
jgi:hypothetical protein